MAEINPNLKKELAKTYFVAFLKKHLSKIREKLSALEIYFVAIIFTLMDLSGSPSK